MGTERMVEVVASGGQAADDAHGTVAEALAPRLAARMAGHDRIFVWAPREYQPAATVRAALSALVGEDWIVEAERGTARARAANVGGRTMFVDLGALAPVEALSLGAHWDGLSPDFPASHLVAVAECDELGGPDLSWFDLVIDHRDLSVLESEVPLLQPAAAGDPVLARRLQLLTGGVPQLLAEPGLPGAGPEVLEPVCRDWAERIYDLVFADPLLEAQVWAPRASGETIRLLTGAWQERPVEAWEVEVARAASVFVSGVSVEPFLPEGLAAALLQLLRARDPERAAETRGRFLTLAETQPGITGPDRMRILTGLRGWRELDRVLGRTMHLLIHLSRFDCEEYAARWPDHVPRGLRHLEAARRFIGGDLSPAAAPQDTPQLWQEFAFLFANEVIEPDSAVGRLQRWFAGMVANGWPSDRQRAAQLLTEVTAALAAEADQLADADAATRRDDLALVAGVLLGVSEAALQTGAPDVAQECHRTASRMGFVLGPAVWQYSTLWPGTLVRGALIAAVGGAPLQARTQLEQYRQVAIPGEPTHEVLAELAQRYSSDNAAALVADPGTATVDLDTPLAPQQLQAEALRLALLSGQGIAADWLRTMLSRASWGQRPEWEWWPGMTVLALLDAQAGRVGLAESRLANGSIPRPLEVTVRASIEVAKGQYQGALRLTEQVLQLEVISLRWRMAATGVRLAALAARDDVACEVGGLLDREDWANSLAVVALLPDPARTLIVDRLGPDAAGLPGLGAAPRTPDPGRQEAQLTPRQLEVLRALAHGGTMPAIAKELFVSVETVRSTAKELYRRLGVHSRDSAIQVGRVRGLIDG
ncbi:helix-turn-helix transcriptional regulator [Enemella evansiae]|uniref:helix-turn-helix transcriptional regulator n=1 Tax=Enemella evansiae TaxID=2016499 RepID=UPI001140622F|nr:LuxR C-terminal-related transcriptional regulator [Enemella evansiae]